MNPIREDEDDVLARLESRLGSVADVISGLKRRVAELESQLRGAADERDAALAEAQAAREDAKQYQEEADSLRTRQKQAAARIKTLLNQVEQMDLLSEN